MGPLTACARRERLKLTWSLFAPHGHQHGLTQDRLQAAARQAALVAPGAAAESDANASEVLPRGSERMKRAKTCGERNSCCNPGLRQ